MNCRRLHSRILPLLLVALLATACTDADLNTVAKALTGTAAAVSVFQSTVIQAGQSGLITEAVTRQLLEAAIQVDQAGQQAVAVTRGINALAPADRTNLLEILNPVIAALSNVQSTLLMNIQDTGTRQTIEAGIMLIQTSLNTAKLVLAANGPYPPLARAGGK